MGMLRRHFATHLLIDKINAGNSISTFHIILDIISHYLFNTSVFNSYFTLFYLGHRSVIFLYIVVYY